MGTLSTINNTKPGDRIIFWSSFTGIVMFFIRSFIVWSCFSVILLSGEDIQETDANLPLDLSFTAYALALWTMSLSFVLRIDYGFKNTFLAYHPTAIMVLYILALILLLLAVVISVFVAMDRLDVVGAWMGPAILGFHFIFSVVMIFFLFRKVFVAMTLKFNQSVRAQDGGDNVDKMSIIRLDNIDAFTRYALLMVIGLMSTYIFLVLVVVSLNTANHLRLGYVFIASDLTVNASVLFLLFPIADKWYFGVCGKCHECCRGCCIDCVYRRVLSRSETDKDKQQFAELILANPL